MLYMQHILKWQHVHIIRTVCYTDGYTYVRMCMYCHLRCRTGSARSASPVRRLERKVEWSGDSISPWLNFIHIPEPIDYHTEQMAVMNMLQRTLIVLTW